MTNANYLTEFHIPSTTRSEEVQPASINWNSLDATTTSTAKIPAPKIRWRRADQHSQPVGV